ncbi:ATP-binding cassette domain-containing protein [Niallia sp. JL1B1071]|uniref:ATP-binding cassette domain-containing protein n=1 Tax=Niallia tiangongensis TaxID=3237105 RepID=UPI0037DC0CCA
MGFDIKMNQVSVKFRKYQALKDISLHLEANKIYGLIGRNGAGKSTLLPLLASFTQPTAGSINIADQDPFENAAIMSEVTFVFETDYSAETEKVKGMIEAVERYRPHFDRQYALELVKLFKLPLDKYVSKLSKGMQSALNVTLGLASRSKITIFDEAYNGMDAPTREKFYKEVLADYERFPRTIILSTHLVSEMDYLFEEVVILKKGEVIIKEPIDLLLEKGAAITGSKQAVEEFVQDMVQLNSQTLGGTKSVMVYEELTNEKREQARMKGLEIGPVSLQDLFIHLTKEEEEYEVQK